MPTPLRVINPRTPGTRHFIGPLTPAQQERREQAKDRFRRAQEIADARYIPMVDAFRVVREQDRRGIYGCLV